MNAAVVLDLVVAGLLVVTIAYAVTLNRRLGQLRRSSAAMEQLIADFNQAAKSAEAGIGALKAVTEHGDGELIRQLEALGALRDELDGLVARAEVQSVRLGGQLGGGRTAPPRRAAPQKPDAGLDAELFDEPLRQPRAGSAPAPKQPRALAG